MRLVCVRRNIALILLLSIAGCGSKSDTPPPSAPASVPSASAAPEAPAAGSTFAAGAGEAATSPAVSASAGENFGQWTVKCATGTQPNKADCAVSQQLFDKASNRRIMAIAVNPVPGGGVKGALVLPLGLELDSGVTLQLDDAAAGPHMRFHTCLPTGCLVDVDFPPATVGLLGTATTMHLSSSSTTGEIAQFDLPMNGFASALNRAISLSVGP